MTGTPNHTATTRHLLARYWESARGYWTGAAAWRAWLLAALLVAIMLLQILVQYRLNYWNRDFFDALERRNAGELWRQVLSFAPLAASSIALAVFSVWGRMTMQRRWRAQLTDRLYDDWLADDRYRKLRFVPGEHQTPEFRIAEDARVATDLPIDLVLGLLNSIITAVTFIGVLSSVGGDLDLRRWGVAATVPSYLTVSVVLYSLLVTTSMLVLARDLPHVWEENKRTEAELRSIGSHLREKGEGTALPDGREDGRSVIRRALAQVLQRWVDLCHQLMRTTLVSHSSTILSPVVGLLLCTPQYLAGTMTLGQVVQAAAAFAVVHGAFSWVTDNYARLAEWTASAHRVATLLLALDEVDGVDRSGNHVADRHRDPALRQPQGD
ncbi:MAG: hypothetical protein JNM30_01655 [Rhodospirillales bacterium]|nr:hypothetical protein [Rhodospirillales bacterium]